MKIIRWNIKFISDEMNIFNIKYYYNTTNMIIKLLFKINFILSLHTKWIKILKRCFAINVNKLFVDRTN